MAAQAFRLTSRVGPQVRKERFGSLDDALAALASRAAAVERVGTAGFLGREYDPQQQIAGRFELRGPRGVRGGVDVRGDGTGEAYTGSIRKRPVARENGESAVDALARALRGAS